MDDTKSEDSFIQCDPVGAPVYEESDGSRRFYMQVAINSIRVKLGDCVKVQLESDSDDGDLDDYEFGYGIVCSIYGTNEEEATCTEETMYVDIRWFEQKKDLSARDTKMFNSLTPIENELIISSSFDEIPAGSIVEGITLKSYSNPMSNINNTVEDEMLGDGQTQSEYSSFFQCRFYLHDNVFQLCKVSELFFESYKLCNNQHAYASVVDEISKSRIQDDENDPYSLAIQRLHISVIPDNLPCRSKEQSQIHQILAKFLCEGTKDGGVIITGMPGSGKTATVLAVVRALEKESKANKIPFFQFVEINCMRIRKPEDAYCNLWYGISSESVSAKVAEKRLKEFYKYDGFSAAAVKHKISETASSSSISSLSNPEFSNAVPIRKRIICLLDELEYLMTKDHNIIYNFLNWSHAPQSGLIVIGVANSMNLADKVFQRSSSSRLAPSNSRVALYFSSYTFNDIKQILMDRISTLSLPNFNESSVELCARKAASFTGDIRTALKIFQRALELFREQRHNSTTGNVALDISKMLQLVKRASDAYINKPCISVLQNLCALDKAVLIALCKNIQATGGSIHIHLLELRDRLHDLLKWAKLKGIPVFDEPAIEVFNTSIIRLLELGYLGECTLQGKICDSLKFSGMAGSDVRSTILLKSIKSQTIGLRLEYGNILGALRDITPLITFVS